MSHLDYAGLRLMELRVISYLCECTFSEMIWPKA